MKRTSIEEWVLRELWLAYPEGAAKNQLASREMAEYTRRWGVAEYKEEEKLNETTHPLPS